MVRSKLAALIPLCLFFFQSIAMQAGTTWLKRDIAPVEAQKVLTHQLFRAIRRDSLADVQAVLEQGVDLNIFDEYGEIIPERLYADGFTRLSDLITPLYEAARKGNVEIVRVLCEAGMHQEIEDFLSRGRYSYHPYWYYRISGKKVCNLLGSLAKAATSRLRGKEMQPVLFTLPIHTAAYYGHEPVIDLFLEYGCEIDGQSFFDVTPLHMAVCNDHTGVVASLCSKGASLEAREAYNSRTVCEIARRYSTRRTIECLESYQSSRSG